MPSTVFAAKAALVTLLENWNWPVSDPVIRWGGPTESEDYPRRGELIYLGSATGNMTRQTLGATRYDENYNVRVVVEVRQYGDDERATAERAYRLRDAVIALFDANRTLSGSVSYLGDQSWTEDTIPLTDGWLTRITIEQAVVGHIHNP